MVTPRRRHAKQIRRRSNLSRCKRYIRAVWAGLEPLEGRDLLSLVSTVVVFH